MSYATVLCGYSLIFHSQVVQWVLVYTVIELYIAIRSHVHVVETDQHLCAGSVKSLMEILKLTEFHSLLSIDVESA